MYAGIETLAGKGDQVQYGGRHLCANGRFPTPDGKAHFHADGPRIDARPRDDDQFVIVTRRGKQFNAMVHEDVDSLNHLRRDAILMATEDAERLGLERGAAIVVENEHGKLLGRATPVEMSVGSVQVHWPEANVLLASRDRSSQAQIPAYKGGHGTVRRARPDDVADRAQPVP